MSSRARSTSSTTSSTTAGQADPAVRVRGVDDGDREARIADQVRAPAAGRPRVEQDPAVGLEAVPDDGLARRAVVVGGRDRGHVRLLEEGADGVGQDGVVAGIGPWYVGGRAARAAARPLASPTAPPSAPTLRSRPWSRRPPMLSGRRVTWFAYAYLCVVGFLLYAIGALTPYLRDALHLSAAEAALHASRARGRADGRRLVGGRGRTTPRPPAGGHPRRALVVAGGVAVMLGGVLPVTLAGAFAIGLGAGVMLAALNIVLGSPGGALAETRFARANTWALLSALFAPLLIAGLAASSLGWQSALLVPLVAAVALEVAGGLPGGGRRASPSGARSLPRSFWVAWLFVVAAVSIEFAYVVWGSSLVAAQDRACRGRRRRRSRPASSAGMLVGRIALGAGLIGSGRWRHWVDAALALAAIGGVDRVAGDDTGRERRRPVRRRASGPRRSTPRGWRRPSTGRATARWPPARGSRWRRASRSWRCRCCSAPSPTRWASSPAGRS